MLFRLLGNAYASQQIESRHFYSCPPDKTFLLVLNITPRQREITHPHRQRFFENSLRTYAKFSEKPQFFTPWYAHVCVYMCAYQGVRCETLVENFAYALNG